MLTVADIAPSVGPPAGRTMVTITGSGFPPDEPPPVGGTFQGTQVVVLVGGAPASSVRVFTESLLTCITPAGALGRVPVEVQNLDTSETATVDDGFWYTRPDFAEGPALIDRIIESLQRRWSDNVLDNTTRSVDTDWASDLDIPFARTAIADLPAITILAPRTPWNRFFSQYGRSEEVRGDYLLSRKPSHTVDLNMGVVTHADNEQHHLGIAEALLIDVNDYSWLDVPSGNGTVRYELEFDGTRQWRTTSTPNESNLMTQRNEIVVRGVQLFDRPGYPDDRVVERTRPASTVLIRGFRK